MTREEELFSQGWKKRSTHGEPRLSEMVAAYEEIGFDVLIEPVRADAQEGCSECMAKTPNVYRTIYTREKPKG